VSARTCEYAHVLEKKCKPKIKMDATRSIRLVYRVLEFNPGWYGLGRLFVLFHVFYLSASAQRRSAREILRKHTNNIGEIRHGMNSNG